MKKMKNQGTLREGLISSPEGSRNNPASLFPMQESEKELTTAVTSGQRCLQLSESLNRPLSLAKMLLVSSVWKMAKHLKGYSLIWKMKGIKPNHLLFQLVPLGRGTEEIEFGLLPTPQAMESPDKTEKVMMLKEQGKPLMTREYGDNSRQFNMKDWMIYHGMLPTPSVMDVRTDIRKPKERSEKANRGGCANLRERVINGMLETPAASDWKGAYRPESLENKTGKVKRHQRLVNIYTTTNIEYNPQTAQLNPTWVCWLMGYPLDWFDGTENQKESQESPQESKTGLIDLKDLETQ